MPAPGHPSHPAQEADTSTPCETPPRRAGPVYRFGAVAFGLAVVLAGYPLDVVQSWLIVITLVTFLAYGYDKAVADSRMTRIPEVVLLALTLTGGTVGAYVAMALFRHKTAKRGFRLQFWLVALLQLALLAIYYGVIQG